MSVFFCVAHCLYSAVTGCLFLPLCLFLSFCLSSSLGLWRSSCHALSLSISLLLSLVVCACLHLHASVSMYLSLCLNLYVYFSCLCLYDSDGLYLSFCQPLFFYLFLSSVSVALFVSPFLPLSPCFSIYRSFPIFILLFTYVSFCLCSNVSVGLYSLTLILFTYLTITLYISLWMTISLFLCFRSDCFVSI